MTRLDERVAYGRAIREQAECLLAAHGSAAGTEALRAAEVPGIDPADRSFREAVAARVLRHCAVPV